MKKSSVLLIVLMILGNFMFVSCGPRMFARHAYRQGHHATLYGTKAQARASKTKKHFWF